MRALRPPRGPVLLFAPHPDDESLGAGAFLAAHARAGGRAAAAFATDGGAGAPRRLRGPRLRAARRGEARAACRLLGVEPEFWGLRDGALAREPRLAAFVAEALARRRPALVLAPAVDDPHPDHRALARAVLAARPRPLLLYEAAGSAPGDAVFDASRTVGLKLAALRRHGSQERAHRWSVFAALRARARALLLPGASAAEAFRRPETA